jgi:hypothetical protein
VEYYKRQGSQFTDKPQTKGQILIATFKTHSSGAYRNFLPLGSNNAGDAGWVKLK